MNIRRAVSKDISTIVRFNQAMALETENKKLIANTVQKGVEAIFRDSSGGFYLIAQINNKIVGQLMVTTEWSDWRNGDFWWIQSVYVLPEYRHTGIYQALYGEVVKKAKKESNVCGLRMYVDNNNKTAQNVYRQLGMNKTTYLVYEDEWLNE